MFELLAINASDVAESTFMDFISTYGVTILWTVVCTIATILGGLVKSTYTKYINDKTKKDVVNTVVMAIQQLYKDLSGEEKLQHALESASEMLAQKGITITDLELRMLIESAVGSFKNAFYKEEEYELEFTPEDEEDDADYVIEQDCMEAGKELH